MPQVVILVADGVRPDTLARALDDGTLPALARLRAEGGLHTVASAFPSVTGLAYAPFVLGRFPAPVGLPGLRWYDRARTRGTWPDHTRSYVGLEMRHVDRDLDAAAPTLFELAPPGLAALNVIGRGLARRDQIGRNAPFILRAGRTHFRGHVEGWLAIDREVGGELARRIRQERPRVVFAALTGIDKTSHEQGHEAPLVREAMQVVDETAARLRRDAEADGRWNDLHLWIVSDHGHSPVRAHDDLADWFRLRGHRTMSHPWTLGRRAEVGVMVSGNAMAHVYLELARRERPWWPALAGRWEGTVAALLERPAADLVLLPRGANSCEVRGGGSAALARRRGRALVERTRVGSSDGASDPSSDPWSDPSSSGSGPAPAARAYRYAYRPLDGDPLGLGGPLDDLHADAAYDACAASDYPDALVQIAHLAGAPRASELIVSAARDWDLRARYEPIPHVSSHGALHQEHMLVPLLVNRPVARAPRRTVDVMPSALAALGVPVPRGLDGTSFL